MLECILCINHCKNTYLALLSFNHCGTVPPSRLDNNGSQPKVHELFTVVALDFNMGRCDLVITYSVKKTNSCNGYCLLDILYW